MEYNVFLRETGELVQSGFSSEDEASNWLRSQYVDGYDPNNFVILPSKLVPA